MFTGIVDHCGLIKTVEKNTKNVCLKIETNFSDLEVGESIAIDGTCLTVTSFNKNYFTVDVSPETMRLTTASYYEQGTQVNLERSLRLMDRLGGHFVTGHVDGITVLKNITSHEEFIEMTFEIPQDFRSFLIKKGSICLNGVSLTLNEIEPENFKVMLIPHTLQRTNLSMLKVGHKVNIEFDYLAKLVLNQINSEVA